MSRRTPFRITGILLVVLTVLLPAHVMGQNIAVLRIESADAVIADAERVMALAGVPMEEDFLLKPVQTGSGLEDLSWMDRSRPMAIVFPMEGMALGEKGIVAAIPALDSDAALAAFVEKYGPSETDSRGVRQFGPTGGGPMMAVSVRDGYLVMGMSRDLAGNFDLESVLEMEGLPPGNVVLDIHLEPIAPMALMGLQAGRQMLDQQMQQQNQKVPEGEEAPEKAEPDIDPAMIMGMVDIYFDLVRDLLNNASRLQISLELAANDMVIHERIIPKAGSTLAGLVEVQKEGWPELARYISPDENAAGIMVSQMTYTPAFLDALEGYVKQYTTAVGGILEAMEDEIPEEFDWIQGVMKMVEETYSSWIGCYSGDLAGTFGFRAGEGFRGTQIAGIADAGACDEMIAMGKRMAEELPAGADGVPMFSVQDNALEHRKVTATKQTFRLTIPESMEGAEELSGMMSAFFGEDGISTYYAVTGDYVVQATGASGGDDFMALVDRVKAKKKKKAKMTGLTPDLFQPLEAGPGFVARIDYARLLREMFEGFPAEAFEEGELREAQAFIGSLPDGAATFVFGARFEAGSVYGGMAFPLKLVEAIGEMAAAERAKQGEAQQEPTAVPEGEATPETEVTEG